MRNIRKVGKYDGVYEYAKLFRVGEDIMYHNGRWKILSIDTTNDGFSTPLLCESYEFGTQEWVDPWSYTFIPIEGILESGDQYERV